MKNNIDHQIKNTKTADYTNLLSRKQRAWWKRLINVQAPYRWNIRRLKPGFTLDIGCGIGRNLLHLEGQGVGIDHNVQSVALARVQGLIAFTPEEFLISEFNSEEKFDSLLLAHVAEHMTQHEVVELLNRYMHVLKSGGKLITICPQEAGYRSDPSHVEFMDFSKLHSIYHQLGYVHMYQYSFPFPRSFGRLFTYNEFIVLGTKT